MLFQNTISSLPFRQWLLQDKENKTLFFFTIVAMTISFGWLKYLYPYPNFIPPDSYSYLDAANNNDFINTWPIGYSKFLRLVSIFTRSHVALVVIQYVLLMISLGYFLYSLRYLLAPTKWLFRTVLGVSIINPLLPHIANFVSSDCLFATLSFIWFTQLLWIIYQPTRILLLMNAVILLLAFMTRYMAIYYPFVSILIILLCPLSKKSRLWGIGCVITLLLAFIGRTQYEYKIKTGTIQFAAFSGWQLAANALYGYAYDEPVVANTPIPLMNLHALVNHHLDSLRRLPQRPDESIGIYYQWDFKSPLVVFKEQKWRNEPKKSIFNKWAAMGPLYNEYGSWLIRNHLQSFIRHYAWPNLIRYYAPPTYFMGMYNWGYTTVQPIAVSWFDWKSNRLPSRLQDRNIYIMTIFPTLLAVINPLIIISGLFFIVFSGFKQSSAHSKRLLGCFALIWVCNTFFSVLSAPIELRYQVFPMAISLPFLIFFGGWIIKSLQTTSGQTLIPVNE